MMYMSYIICCFYIACKISYQIYQEKNIKKREFKTLIIVFALKYKYPKVLLSMN